MMRLMVYDGKLQLIGDAYELCYKISSKKYGITVTASGVSSHVCQSCVHFDECQPNGKFNPSSCEPFMKVYDKEMW